jgi:peroxiredoxin
LWFHTTHFAAVRKPGGWRVSKFLLERSMKSVNWFLSAAALSATCLVAPAFAQVADDARAVLTESQAAVGKAEMMTYKVKKYGTGPLKDIIDLSGDVKLMRPKGAAAPTVNVVGRWKEPGKKDSQMTMTNDGTTVTWLSHSDNTKYQAQVSDAKAQEVLSTAKEFLVTEMVSGQAFENILRMPKVEKRGIDKIGEEMCDLIVGTSADGTRVFTYAISVADRIPRRMEMATGAGESKIAMVTDLTDVKPAQLTTADFAFATPTGWVNQVLSASPANPASTPVTAVNLGPSIGSAAPEFKMTDASGKDHSPASFKGNVVVMQFFGTIYKASIAGSVEMEELAGEMKDKSVAFVGLACKELNPTAGADFFKKNNLSYTLVPKGDDVAAAMNIKGYPSYVVLDKDGKVAAFFQDNPGKAKLAEAVKAAGGM